MRVLESLMTKWKKFANNSQLKSCFFARLFTNMIEISLRNIRIKGETMEKNIHNAEILIYECIKAGILRTSKNKKRVYLYMHYQDGDEAWDPVTIREAAYDVINQNAFSILRDALQKRMSNKKGEDDMGDTEF